MMSRAALFVALQRKIETHKFTRKQQQSSSTGTIATDMEI